MTSVLGICNSGGVKEGGGHVFRQAVGHGGETKGVRLKRFLGLVMDAEAGLHLAESGSIPDSSTKFRGINSVVRVAAC